MLFRSTVRQKGQIGIGNCAGFNGLGGHVELPCALARLSLASHLSMLIWTQDQKLATPKLGKHGTGKHSMRKLELTIATSDYDHLRDFRIGEVRAEGIDPIWLSMDFHEIFARFAARRDWDVSEMSFAKFTALASQPNAEIIGLPVFPSRMFRFSSFYVNRHKGIQSAADLRGKRVGVPE